MIIAIPVLAMALTSSFVGIFVAQRTSFYKILIVGGLSLVVLATALTAFLPKYIFVYRTISYSGVGTGWL